MMVDLLESMAPVSNDQAAVAKVLAGGPASLMVLKEVTKSTPTTAKWSVKIVK
jgi:hypothetical protein